MKSKSAFTLIELAVVMAIVALAVSLLMPMMLEAREEMRRNECANNLRRVGQAWLDHEQSLGYFPSSGWGWRWTGDPDRGFGRRQPGGWGFDVVRFTEYSNVANMGAGLRNDDEKAQAMITAQANPVPFFHCPERRPVTTYPLVRNGFLANNLPECQAGACEVARIDYQANSGNVAAGETGGPGGGRFSSDIPSQFSRAWTGVTFQVSELRLSQISDGLSNTICVGEKYLNVDNYLTGTDAADDNNSFVGIDRDVNGYTASATLGTTPRPNPQFQPQRDRAGVGLNWTFGSAHESGFNVANCDSSVRFLNYDIDYMVFFLLGGRADGGTQPLAR